VKYPFQIARPLYTAAIDIVYSQEMMEEFMSPAMNVYLNGLAQSSKLIYTKKMQDFIQYCEDGTNDGPYNASLEDVSAYVVTFHEEGYKTSTLWSTLSVLLTFFEIGKDENVNAVKKLMYRHLKQWQKDDETKKAKVNERFVNLIRLT